MSCRSYKFDGGVAIVCSPGRHPAIQTCSFCDRVSTRLCDYSILDKTCDKPLCGAHSKYAGKDLDHCPDHPAGALPKEDQGDMFR